jgi:hypothetical protein
VLLRTEDGLTCHCCRGVAQLYEPTVGAIAHKKSLLKASASEEKKPGPVQLLTAQHLGEQRSIDLCIQVCTCSQNLPDEVNLAGLDLCQGVHA